MKCVICKKDVPFLLEGKLEEEFIEMCEDCFYEQAEEEYDANLE